MVSFVAYKNFSFFFSVLLRNQKALYIDDIPKIEPGEIYGGTLFLTQVWRESTYFCTDDSSGIVILVTKGYSWVIKVVSTSICTDSVTSKFGSETVGFIQVV